MKARLEEINANIELDKTSNNRLEKAHAIATKCEDTIALLNGFRDAFNNEAKTRSII
jgi:hypothetical protein